jgi:iron complex outermembrane receptor protein
MTIGARLVRVQALVGGSLFACALASAAPAIAQSASTAAAPEDTGLTEIVVTARKVAENLQDVPISVTAFSGADLQRQNVQKFQDLANFTPGLTMRPGSSTPSAVTITLRGQVQTDILATLDPSVGTYVDGVYWARAYGLNADFLDVANAQVLKGPQGTLFGRNTVGGALLLNSNNPDLGDTSGRASVTYGAFNEFQATGVLNVPIVTDKLGIRVAVQRFSRDGYTENVAPPSATSAIVNNTVVARQPPAGPRTGLKYDNRDRWQARGKIEFRPTENFSLIGSAEFFEMDETAPARNIMLALPTYTASNSTFSTANTAGLFVGIINGSPPATAGAAGNALLNAEADRLRAAPTTTSNNEVPYAFAKTQTFNLTASLDTSFGNAKIIGSHRKVETYAGVDLEGSQYPVHFTEGQQELSQDSIEAQVTGKAFGDAVDFAAGAFYFTEGGFDQSISIVVPALNPNTSHFYGLIDNSAWGIYAQATWHITDGLAFIGGLRYSDETKGLETRNNNYNRISGRTTCAIVNTTTSFDAGGEVVGPPQCALSRQDSFGAWTYTAGLQYNINDDIMIYAKTDKGFRSGGQNLRAPQAAFFIPFEPEIAYSYEAGFKSQFLDRRVRFNVSAYTVTVNNIQRSTLISNPQGAGGTATILGNAGKARFNGLEADLQVQVVDGLTFSATGSLVDPKYLEYSDLTGDRSFERFNSVSGEQFSLAVDYSTRVGFGKIDARIDYAFTSSQATSEYNFPANPSNDAIIAATTRPAMGLLGARLALGFGKQDQFEIAVFGRNITNNRAYVNNLLVAPLGYISGVRFEPATYGVMATAKF